MKVIRFVAENVLSLLMRRFALLVVKIIFLPCWPFLSHMSRPTIAVTLCEICMPEAFCGFETLVEKFC